MTPTALLLGALSGPVEPSASTHLADTRSKEEFLRVIDAHDVVVQRICAGDPVGAASAMSYHFDLAMVNVQRHAERRQGPARELAQAQSRERPKLLGEPSAGQRMPSEPMGRV